MDLSNAFKKKMFSKLLKFDLLALAVSALYNRYATKKNKKRNPMRLYTSSYFKDQIPRTGLKI
ncbi:exported hypothetical protein [Candidatus Desulfosporosinus infrequens]|uniref:Uncharacterized protein n=1 Tax=Candidatus Desulfosporosinus infrequens TaxID=2043169 RepID=A0A2U3LR66_9FIRM|nr:exported hypothetical protein [Candidatus Desulfosporosinus infrequens]